MSYRSGSSHNVKDHATLWSGLCHSQRLTVRLHRSKENSNIGPSVEQLQVLVLEGVGFEIEGQNKQACTTIIAMSHRVSSFPQFIFPKLSKKQTDHLNL